MTKKKPLTNLPVSIRERLKNIADNKNSEFQNLVQQFFWERFLYRLSISEYRSNLILKGAMMMIALNKERNRPTRDIDFLGVGISNQIDSVADIIRKIVMIECEDGIHFATDSILAEPINESDLYSGIRIKLTGTLDSIKQRIFIDIGFGDSIEKVETPQKFPVLLSLPSPEIYIYPIESSVSEKVEALVSLQLLTSRMKDIYDIAFYSKNFEFTSTRLSSALLNTFQRRGTDIEKRFDIFSVNFRENKEKELQWQAFHKTNGLKAASTFASAISEIERFIEPVLTGDFRIWEPERSKWVR
ncbi:MAG: nucleotidyl transferase AbiEii/AbiGii toxin family protein [Ignavibacteriaceae bacterium]|nr:nucleotidyl transferase AbiEii/AbiGii toxin family protein [Ignavibacteriaceae bacterium]